jgi:hypothetical protein
MQWSKERTHNGESRTRLAGVQCAAIATTRVPSARHCRLISVARLIRSRPVTPHRVHTPVAKRVRRTLDRLRPPRTPRPHPHLEPPAAGPAPTPVHRALQHPPTPPHPRTTRTRRSRGRRVSALPTGCSRNTPACVLESVLETQGSPRYSGVHRAIGARTSVPASASLRFGLHVLGRDADRLVTGASAMSHPVL